MKSAPITVLEINYYDSDAEADAGKEVVYATPSLFFYPSAAHAAYHNEGLNIIEGDIWFFASDGTPMEAHFSQPPRPPRENAEGKFTYFPGVYTLHPGQGETLTQHIENIIASNAEPYAHIILRVSATDALAQSKGWANIGAMKTCIEQCAGTLPAAMAARIRLEEVPY